MVLAIDGNLYIDCVMKRLPIAGSYALGLHDNFPSAHFMTIPGFAADCHKRGVPS
jgi:hypothetical protein